MRTRTRLADATVGTCQNLRWTRADLSDSYYCGAPVLALGLDRDICQECKARGTAYGERLISSASAGIAAAPGRDEWVAHTEAMIVDLYGWLDQEAAGRAPLSKLHKIRVDIERRERCLAAVLAAPVPAEAAA